jgi:hypothetical protein
MPACAGMTREGGHDKRREKTAIQYYGYTLHAQIIILIFISRICEIALPSITVFVRLNGESSCPQAP